MRRIFDPGTGEMAVNEARNEVERNRQMIVDYLSRIKEPEIEAPMSPKIDTGAPMSVPESNVSQGQQMSSQGSILPTRAAVTQKFGNINPGVEVFSGGINKGVDFGIKEGTPLALPPGKWIAVETYDKASGRGRIGNKENKGYGNSVLVRNAETGETLRFSHLNGVNVQPGKIYGGGTVIGVSGATGNVTGPHLDLEYGNTKGILQDVLNSPYARYIFGQ